MRIQANVRSFVNILFSVCILQIEAETISDVDNLLTNVFSADVYNKKIRGQNNLAETTHVEVSFKLHKILRFDELQGTIQFRGNIQVDWTDERLVWKPKQYNGLEYVYVAADTVWIPEIIIANPSKPLRFFGDDTARLLNKHKYDGRANLIIGDAFDCTCDVDLTSFPWDTQKCSLEVTVFGYQVSEVKLMSTQKYVDTSKFRLDGVWKLTSTKVSALPSNATSIMVFEHVLERRSMFLLVNIILPIVTLSFLTLLVFFIPIDSGERISFSLTLLLSTALFMTLVSENLPPNAKTVANVCYLLLCVLIHNTITCLLNIISLHVYFKNNSEPGQIWKRLYEFYTCKPRCLKSKAIFPADNMSKVNKDDDDDNEEGYDTQVYDKDDIMKNDMPGKTVTWKNICGLLDSFFFCIMTLMLICSYAYFGCLVLQII